MIESMVKIEIVGERNRIDEVLSILHEFGAAHLEKSLQTGSDVISETPLSDSEKESKDKLKEALQVVNEVKDTLDIKEEVEDLSRIESPEELLKEARKFRVELVKIQSQEKALLDEKRNFSDYRAILGALLPLFEKRGEEEKERTFIGVTIPRSEARLISYIEGELEKIAPGEIEILTSDMRGERLAVLLIMPRNLEKSVHDLIWKEGLSELRLPDKYQGLSLRETLVKIDLELSLLPGQLEAVKEKKLRFREEISVPLLLLRNRILEKIEKFIAKERYTNSTYFGFLLRAWLPKSKVKKLERELTSKLGDSFYMEAYSPERREYERVPVHLKNPKILEPFQLILNIFQPPIYGTVDPTPFLYIFFPFYFGFMLGDLGYGAVGLLMSLFLWRASKPGSALRKVSILSLWAMGWTLVFGVLYGEAFGDLGRRFGVHPLLVERTRDVTPVLLASIIFGVIQVMLGVLLGIYNNFKVGHNKHALFEIFRFIGLLSLIVALSGALHKIPNFFGLFGAGLFVFSLIAALVVEGIAAPLEILSAVGNMFSFARLMAIGMSSAILAVIANLMGGMMGIFVVGVVIALMFHVLNLILGIFDPTVQGLRLQFVEFFSKFFMPGGRAYRPFRKGGSHYVA